ERAIVDRSLIGSCSQKLAERASGMKVGDPREPDTVIGPLVNTAAVERVTELVHDAASKGAEILSGGQADGPCFPPTVVKGVTPDMRLYSEESFGPVLAVMAADSPEQAVRMANDTEYGLSAAVFGQDVPAALESAEGS